MDNPYLNPVRVRSLYASVDWQQLAEQKELLVSMASDRRITEVESDALCGIIHLLDFLQDDAECKGYPVVFLVEEDNG